MNEITKGIILIVLVLLQVCLCFGLFICTIKELIKIKKLEKRIKDSDKNDKKIKN